MKPSRSQKPKSGVAEGYLHGFSREEQDRLYGQARLLEKTVYANVDFSKSKNILEVGCGVGAQTEILLERFPALKITGVDASEPQLARARERLQKPMREKRVTIEKADALKLPYADDTFDGAFFCWLLEHVRAPIEILAETRRVMSSDSVIYCTEVLNSSFYVHPYSPATLTYWFAFNDHQWNLKGDPFVGAKLGNYLLAAGFQDIRTRLLTIHLDNRMPKLRSQFMDYWIQLLLSGAPGLLAAKKTDEATVKAMKTELERIKKDPDSVFFYTAVQAEGRAY